MCEQRACACLSAAGEYRRRVFGMSRMRTFPSTGSSGSPGREVWSGMSSSVTVTKYGEMGEVNGIPPSATPFLTRTPHRHSEPASGSSKYKQPKETNNMNLERGLFSFILTSVSPGPIPRRACSWRQREERKKRRRTKKRPRLCPRPEGLPDLRAEARNWI